MTLKAAVTARKPKTAFFHVVVIIVIFCMLTVTCLLTFLWTYLSVYEQSNPKTYVQEVLNAYRKGDYSHAMELAQVESKDFFDVEQYEAYVKKTLGDYSSVHLFEISVEDGKIFELKGSGGALRFALEEHPNALPFGMSSYSLRQETVPTTEYTVYTPSHGNVLVNGKPLDAAKYQHGQEPVAIFSVLKDPALVPSLNAYRLPGFVERPELALEGKQEGEYRFEWSGNVATFTLVPSGNTEEVQKAAENAGKLYARFVSKDASFAEFAKVLHRETVYYDVIRTYSNLWTIPHNSYRFEDFQFESISEYSKDAYSAVVSFDYVVFKDRSEEGYRNITKHYPAKYRISLLRIDSAFRVVNIEVL